MMMLVCLHSPPSWRSQGQDHRSKWCWDWDQNNLTLTNLSTAQIWPNLRAFHPFSNDQEETSSTRWLYCWQLSSIIIKVSLVPNPAQNYVHWPSSKFCLHFMTMLTLEPQWLPRLWRVQLPGRQERQPGPPLSGGWIIISIMMVMMMLVVDKVWLYFDQQVNGELWRRGWRLKLK